jgi:hypothetical protein
MLLKRSGLPDAVRLLASSPQLAAAVESRRRARGAAYVAVTLLAGTVSPLAAGVLGLAVGFGALLLVTGSTSTEGLHPAIVVTAGLVLAFVPIPLFVHLWLVIFERRTLSTVGLPFGGWAARYARGWLVGIVLFGSPVAAMAVAGLAHSDVRAAGTVGLTALPGVALLLVGWAVQGAGEEVLTRGLMLQTVALRFGPVAGIAASSGVFALLHSLNANLTALAMLNLFLFGVFACVVALREGSLWGVCAIHSAWNWTQAQVFGLAVSGGAVPGGTLLGLRIVGPDIVTGGAFGPEGGLAVTAVLLAGTAMVLVRPGPLARSSAD